MFRKTNLKCCSLPWHTFYTDCSTVAMHRLACDSKAKTSAPGFAVAVLINTVESVEDPGKILCRDADPGIRYPDHKGVLFNICCYRNQAAPGSVAYGIADEVKKDTGKSCPCSIAITPLHQIQPVPGCRRLVAVLPLQSTL